MKNLFIVCLLFIVGSINAQSKYFEADGTWLSGNHITVMGGAHNTLDIGYSRTVTIDNVDFSSTLNFGGNIERTQFDIVNNGKPFYALYGSMGYGFRNLSITVKAGITRLQKMDTDHQVNAFTYGGSIEYRVLDQVGVIVGADATCDCPLIGVSVHL